MSIVIEFKDDKIIITPEPKKPEVFVKPADVVKPTIQTLITRDVVPSITLEGAEVIEEPIKKLKKIKKRHHHKRK